MEANERRSALTGSPATDIINSGGKHMGKTSTEVKQRWIDENYSRYAVSFRKDSDKEIIDYIDRRKKDGLKTSEIFREALERCLNEENAGE